MRHSNMTAKAPAVLARLLRHTVIACSLAGLAGLLCFNAAQALNIYGDYFVTLSARPLGMGGAFAALSGPESVFYNPAGLAAVRQLRLMHNHSARHFPGSREGGATEFDQLDGDTQCITVPLPLATYAHGLTLNGEMGYDYRNQPADGSLGYPRGRYWGTEDYDTLAFNFGLPVSAGYTLRRHLGRFTPAEDDEQQLPWIRLGDGEQWGIIARVWPGLDYGISKTRVGYDWTVLEQRTADAPTEFTSRMKSSRSGWVLAPVAWLTFARDSVSEDWLFEHPKDSASAEAFAGIIHTGDRHIERLHRGVELNIGNLLWLRRGSYDGRGTIGVSFNLLGTRLNYAEVKDLLPELIGDGAGFEDIHIYGFDVPLS